MDDQEILNSIKCPFTVNYSDRTSIIQLVTWLEDRKIREYVIEEREKLRVDSDLWDANFSEYLAALGCPIAWNPKQVAPALSWLISCSVAMEYEDAAATEFNSAALSTINDEEELAAPVGSSSTGASDPVGESMEEEEATDGEAPSEDMLTAEIDKLASLLGLARSRDGSSGSGTTTASTSSSVEDNAALLLRCNRVVRLRCGATDMGTDASTQADLSTFPLGFDTGDGVVNQVAVVLKMLYMFDFRELQDDLNNLIMLGQEYTANPKTNQSLGKVGF